MIYDTEMERYTHWSHVEKLYSGNCTMKQEEMGDQESSSKTAVRVQIMNSNVLKALAMGRGKVKILMILDSTLHGI